jgi:flagellar biosynthesis chaperone FliJ
MPQFTYRLQVLLDQKITAKQEAQQVLADRQKELRAEQDALEECRRQETLVSGKIGDARGKLLSRGGLGTSGEAVRLYRDYLRGLQADLDAAKDTSFSQQLRLREAEERLAEARSSLAEASRQVEVLEKHRARLERRFLREAEHQEALAQEEMGNVMFSRRRQAR